MGSCVKTNDVNASSASTNLNNNRNTYSSNVQNSNNASSFIDITQMKGKEGWELTNEMKDNLIRHKSWARHALKDNIGLKKLIKDILESSSSSSTAITNNDNDESNDTTEGNEQEQLKK